MEPDEFAFLEEEAARYQAIKRFEDLVAWQKARELTASVYALTREPGLRRDFGFCGQLQRAAVSVMSNIAEGYERGTTHEYHHFLTIAKGSCAEVRSLLYVALDAGYVDPRTFETHQKLAEEVARIVGGLRASIAKRIATSNGRVTSDRT